MRFRNDESAAHRMARSSTSDGPFRLKQAMRLIWVWWLLWMVNSGCHTTSGRVESASGKDPISWAFEDVGGPAWNLATAATAFYVVTGRWPENDAELKSAVTQVSPETVEKLKPFDDLRFIENADGTLLIQFELSSAPDTHGTMTVHPPEREGNKRGLKFNLAVHLRTTGRVRATPGDE